MSEGFEPPDPPLQDDVVLLRPWRDADVPQLVAICQDPDIQRYIPIPRPYGTADAEHYVERTTHQWEIGAAAAFAIVEPDDTDRVLGAINVTVSGVVGNSGYWVAPDARGRGLASRALNLITDWAFAALDIGVMLLEIRPQNEASQAVAAHAGYHEAGTLDVNVETGKQHGLIYSRLASDR